MFFHMELKRDVHLHPSLFGHHIQEILISQLRKEVEGTCSSRHGFVVAVTHIVETGKGFIAHGTGFAVYSIKYNCVVFRPFKGEILEAVVTRVNQMGFFAEAGPLQIFVSNHLFPDGMEFQSGDTSNYTSSDGSVKIQQDSEVIIKIIGSRMEDNKIFCVGTIKGDFLGVVM